MYTERCIDKYSAMYNDLVQSYRTFSWNISKNITSHIDLMERYQPFLTTTKLNANIALTKCLELSLRDSSTFSYAYEKSELVISELQKVYLTFPEIETQLEYISNTSMEIAENLNANDFAENSECMRANLLCPAVEINMAIWSSCGSFSRFFREFSQ